MSRGDGYIDIFKQVDPDGLSRELKHAPVRERFFISLNQIIVTDPSRESNEAQLMIYRK